MKDSDNIPKLQAYNKWNIFMSPFGAKYVTFWSKVCHLLAQSKFITYSFLKSYVIKSFLINNLENNLINYSNKLFNKERGTSKKVLGTFWPTSFYVRQQGRICVGIITEKNYKYR